MKVYFAHGSESGPRGFKIKRLAAVATRLGCDVESVDYSDLANPDLRVERLLSLLENEQDCFVLVGSSMGGYVSLVASEKSKPEAVFLMAPALYMPTFKVQRYRTQSAHVEVVHGWADEVILAEHSIKYARGSDCCLHLISGDHGLNGSIDVIESLFELFLLRAMKS